MKYLILLTVAFSAQGLFAQEKFNLSCLFKYKANGLEHMLAKSGTCSPSDNDICFAFDSAYPTPLASKKILLHTYFDLRMETVGIELDSEGTSDNSLVSYQGLRKDRKVSLYVPGKAYDPAVEWLSLECEVH